MATKNETEETQAPDGSSVLADCRLDMNDLVRLGMALEHAEQRLTYVEGVPVAVLPNGVGVQAKPMVDVLEVRDARAPAPLRRKGTATHQELQSFIDHVNRFKDPESAVWADTAQTKLVAVLNYHAAGAAPPFGGDVPKARWGDHRSVYACPLSEAWKRWTSVNEKPFAQEAFGDFIEANMTDLAAPGTDDADMPAPNQVLQMARSLVIRQRGDFERTINVTTGEATLVNRYENEAHSTRIPRAFLLQLPVFEAGAPWRVEARVRFKLEGGKATFAVHLYQAEAIKREAFEEVRERVRKDTDLPVFCGTPE